MKVKHNTEPPLYICLDPCSIPVMKSLKVDSVYLDIALSLKTLRPDHQNHFLALYIWYYVCVCEKTLK